MVGSARTFQVASARSSSSCTQMAFIGARLSRIVATAESTSTVTIGSATGGRLRDSGQRFGSAFVDVWGDAAAREVVVELEPHEGARRVARCGEVEAVGEVLDGC